MGYNSFRKKHIFDSMGTIWTKMFTRHPHAGAFLHTSRWRTCASHWADWEMDDDDVVVDVDDTTPRDGWCIMEVNIFVSRQISGWSEPSKCLDEHFFFWSPSSLSLYVRIYLMERRWRSTLGHMVNVIVIVVVKQPKVIIVDNVMTLGVHLLYTWTTIPSFIFIEWCEMSPSPLHSNIDAIH